MLWLAGGGGDGGRGAELAVGQDLYRTSCALCHGLNAEGRGLLGNDLRANEFIRGLTDEDLVEFIRRGRPATHPDNSRGIERPPRGGNPRLTDEQMRDIAIYLRSLEQSSHAP
jgi:disulfide bond formation protein DsbB